MCGHQRIPFILVNVESQKLVSYQVEAAFLPQVGCIMLLYPVRNKLKYNALQIHTHTHIRSLLVSGCCVCTNYTRSARVRVYFASAWSKCQHVLCCTYLYTFSNMLLEQRAKRIARTLHGFCKNCVNFHRSAMVY